MGRKRVLVESSEWTNVTSCDKLWVAEEYFSKLTQDNREEIKESSARAGASLREKATRGDKSVAAAEAQAQAPNKGWVELLDSLRISEVDRVALDTFGILDIEDLKQATESDLVEAGLKTFQARKLIRACSQT